jgi:hypothetical protein
VSDRNAASCRVLRAGLAVISPNIAEIARAVGLREQTLYAFKTGRRTVPPAVRVVVANLLRKQSELLIVAASEMENADAGSSERVIAQAKQVYA